MFRCFSFYTGASILGASKLQTSAVTSTLDAELDALAACTKQFVWLRSLLSEMDLGSQDPTSITEDDVGAIAWTKHVRGLRKVKHVGLSHYYMSQIEVVYSSSAENCADSLTKTLSPELNDVHHRHPSVLS